MNKSAVKLKRVSSKEQAESGYSLEAQEKLIDKHCQKTSLAVKKSFEITETASKHKQRKTFKEMMDFLRKEQIEVLVVEKTDRLLRNLKDAVMVDDWIEADEKRQVHFVKENFILHKNSKSHEKFIWNIKVSVAQFYTDNLGEEVKKGQKEKLAQGWLPTKPPLGYKTVGEKGHKIHVIDEDKAPLVKRMFDLYASGNYSLKKLTDQMYKDGLRSDKGNKVVKSRLHGLLTDPFYIGKNRWKGKLTQGKQKTFISKEVFDKVQSLLKSKTTPKYNKHNYLFKSLLKCAECGGTVTWEVQKGTVYGHCNHYRNCSQKTWSKQPEVENQLIDRLENLQIKNPRITDWIRKALKESHQDEIEYHSSATRELNQRTGQLKQRLDRLYDDKLDGKIKADFYERKFKQYSEELEEASNTLNKYNKASIKYFELGMNIYELSQRAKQIYLKAKSEEDKRKLIRLVFGKMTLDEGKLETSYSPTFQLLSKAVQYTNSSKMAKISKTQDKIFEPQEKLDMLGKYEDLELARSTLLRG